MSALRLPNYIDGEFRPPIEGKYIENINPSDGSVISYVPDSNAPDVDLAVAAAKRALASPEWNANVVTLKKRAEWLKKLADGIEARLEQFAQAESRDTGKRFFHFSARLFQLLIQINNRQTTSTLAYFGYSSCH